MLAMGRALMAKPRLLLLDEPSMGIAPILVERIYETIAEINRQGMTILLVEQNANFALDVSARGYVLATGKVVLSRLGQRAARRPRGPEGLPRDMTSLAVIGATALYLLFIWLASAIAASWLSRPQGLRREGRPRHGSAAVGRRGARLAAVAASRRVALEDGGHTAPSQPTGANRQSSPQARSPPTAPETPVPDSVRRWAERERNVGQASNGQLPWPRFDRPYRCRSARGCGAASRTPTTPSARLPATATSSTHRSPRSRARAGRGSWPGRSARRRLRPWRRG